jgi:hypothetical protein
LQPAPAPAAAAPAPRSEERREKIPREKGPGLFVSNIPAGTAHADLEALFVAKLSPQFKVAGASVLERGVLLPPAQCLAGDTSKGVLLLLLLCHAYCLHGQGCGACCHVAHIAYI